MTEFDGIKLHYPRKPRTWTFDGCFDPGVNTYIIRWLDWDNGWLEIEYEDGACMVFQGQEKPA